MVFTRDEWKWQMRTCKGPASVPTPPVLAWQDMSHGCRGSKCSIGLGKNPLRWCMLPERGGGTLEGHPVPLLGKSAAEMQWLNEGGGGRSGLKSDPDFTCAACLLPPPLTSRLIDLRAHGDSGDQVRVVAVLSSGLLDLSLTYSLSHCCCLHVLWGGNSQSEGVVAGPDLSSSLPLACLASAASISMYGNGQGRGRPALRPSHALFCVDAWQKD